MYTLFTPEVWVWGWPQITWLVLITLNVGITLALHGKPRGPHNVWWTIGGTPISFAILYFGGFFTA